MSDIAYTNVTQDDWVMATTEPRPVTTVQCSIQFCPASHPAQGIQPWYCAKHRWPGGEGDESLTVFTDATSDDSTFVDGVNYIIVIQHGRDVKARVLGMFSKSMSGDTRLRFNGAPGCYVEVRPDHILDVVAV